MSTQQTNKPAANKKREVQFGYREARRHEALQAILTDPIARRYLWELLSKMVPLGDSRAFDPQGAYDTHRTAGREAVKEFGAAIVNDILKINPEAFLLYVKESKYLDKKEPQDDEVAAQNTDES